MSCYIVTDETIDVLVYAARNDSKYMGIQHLNGYALRGLSPWTDADELGRRLKAQNYASYEHRYPDHRKTPPEEIAYAYKKPRREPTFGDVYGCARCYDYQACETDGYGDTDISHWIDGLVSAVTRKEFERSYGGITWGMDGDGEPNIL